MILPADIPACRFRGEPATPAGQHFPCRHPLMRGPQEGTIVSFANCRNCKYPVWNLAQIVSNYRQGVDLQPTEEEYEARATLCDPCPARVDNACPRAAGTCTLEQKLTKGSFCCPDGKFKAIERER